MGGLSSQNQYGFHVRIQSINKVIGGLQNDKRIIATIWHRPYSSYLTFAFANWNIAWAAHVNTVMRVTFVWFYVAICCIAAFAYLEIKERQE